MEDQVQIQVGSRWYAWGQHWRVVATDARRDNEDALELQLVDSNGKNVKAISSQPVVITRLFLRRAVPSENA